MKKLIASVVRSNTTSHAFQNVTSFIGEPLR